MKTEHIMIRASAGSHKAHRARIAEEMDKLLDKQCTIIAMSECHNSRQHKYIATIYYRPGANV